MIYVSLSQLVSGGLSQSRVRRAKAKAKAMSSHFQINKPGRLLLACLLATHRERERYTLTSCGGCSAAVRLDQLGGVYPEEAHPTRNVHNCRGADQGARRSIAEMIEEGGAEEEEGVLLVGV